MQRYFVGLGSNIRPEENIVRMLAALFALTDEIQLSRIIATQPVGFVSDNTFLNLSVAFASALDPTTLKQHLNGFEEALGRDRSDSNSKIKDRTADFDILFALPAGTVRIANQLLPPEPYNRSHLLELIAAMHLRCDATPLPLERGVALQFNDTTIGLAPTILQRDATLTVTA